MSIAAGDLSCQVTIEKRTTAVDSLNQSFDVWVPILQLWAWIMGEAGMAAVRASAEGVVAAPVRFSVRIRYRPDGIDEGMRVNYKGVYFDIKQLRHDYARKEYTDLVCEVGGNNG